MRIVPPTAECIAEAASLIRSGEVVAYPTETVYGLAVDPFSAIAIEKLFAVKGRAEIIPVLLIASNLDQIGGVAETVTDEALRYIDRFWPGPLSLVLPKAQAVPAEVCGGGSKICVRVPACDIARALCEAVGHAITSTSANKSGAAAAASPNEINLAGVALCVDGGKLAPSLPSTVFDPDTRTIIRHGAIPETVLFSR